MFDIGLAFREYARRLTYKSIITLIIFIACIAAWTIGAGAIVGCSKQATQPPKEVTTKTEGIPNRDVFVCGSLSVHRWHDDEKGVTCWLADACGHGTGIYCLRDQDLTQKAEEVKKTP